MTLRIFGITKPGFVSLTVAVAALWTCVGMEIATRHQTTREAASAIQNLARLKHKAHPPSGTTPVRNPFQVELPARPFTA